MENIKTKYEERTNTEKNGIELYFEDIPTPEERNILKNNGYKWHSVKKCWYKSNNYDNNKTVEKTQEAKQLENIIELTEEEKKELVKELWKAEDMQKYLLKTYDFYKTKDGLILELEKVNKISIEKTMYYDDETEAPEVTESNFILYNRYNIPGRNLEAYLEEKEKLQTVGCATGLYDYKGLYFETSYSNSEKMVCCGWHDEKHYFKRYLTEEEQNDYIELTNIRKAQYIERLKKYWKKYGQHVTTYGYWANR